MMLRAPSFWATPEGANTRAAKLLAPVSELYHQIVARKIASAVPVRTACPVICIGNITMGGVGKTPFTQYLAAKLSDLGLNVHLLMRGYGGRLRGPHLVTPQDTADDVGDEAAMLAQTLTVWISRDRPEGAQAAASAGADIILMDDGFQNPSLHKDISLVLIDGVTGLGNGKVFPAGPLREKPQHALKRADAVVIVGGTEDALPPCLPDLQGLPVIRSAISSDTTSLPNGKAVVAFAGIGRPEKFFDALKHRNVSVVSSHPYPDHHPYTVDDLAELRRTAQELDALLVTTEKDYMRLHPSQRDGIHFISAQMEIRTPETLERILAPLMQKTDPS